MLSRSGITVEPKIKFLNEKKEPVHTLYAQGCATSIACIWCHVYHILIYTASHVPCAVPKQQTVILLSSFYFSSQTRKEREANSFKHCTSCSYLMYKDNFELSFVPAHHKTLNTRSTLKRALVVL